MTNEGETWADACRSLANDDRALSEIVEALPRLEAAAEPCGPEFVVTQLAPLLALYNVPKKSGDEAKAFWGLYIDALQGLPREAIKAGVRDYVADASSEWFPKPGPLRALCERHAVPVRMAVSRARKAVTL